VGDGVWLPNNFVRTPIAHPLHPLQHPLPTNIFHPPKTPKNIRLNVGQGQSIRTETLTIFINSYRPNAIALTRLKKTIN
jgi:hypothetical protein